MAAPDPTMAYVLRQIAIPEVGDRRGVEEEPAVGRRVIDGDRVPRALRVDSCRAVDNDRAERTSCGTRPLQHSLVVPELCLDSDPDAGVCAVGFCQALNSQPGKRAAALTVDTPASGDALHGIKLLGVKVERVAQVERTDTCAEVAPGWRRPADSVGDLRAPS